MEETDLPLLELSLELDEYHTTTQTEFFMEPGTLTKVYEDENGPGIFVKGSPVLRLDLQFVDNKDNRRNLKIMMAGFPPLMQKAREMGYKEISFQSDVPVLKAFCTKHFGFVESSGEMRLGL
jgi:hypothetical protein